jgi:hypothetical protein
LNLIGLTVRSKFSSPAVQIVARMTDYNVKPSVRTTESLMQLAAEQNDLPVAVRLWQASTSLPAWKLPQDWSQV